jgi:hypothetical protein
VLRDFLFAHAQKLKLEKRMNKKEGRKIKRRGDLSGETFS